MQMGGMMPMMGSQSMMSAPMSTMMMGANNASAPMMLGGSTQMMNGPMMGNTMSMMNGSMMGGMGGMMGAQMPMSMMGGASQMMGMPAMSMMGSMGMMGDSCDILDCLQKDHRTLEGLFRAMRNRQCDRAALLQQFAALLVAHSDAEEKTFYARIHQFCASNPAAMNGIDLRVEDEHTEGLLALLALMEEPNTMSKMWEDKFTVLVKGITEHVDDEEKNVHNIARMFFSPEERMALGEAFMQARETALAGGAVASRTCSSSSACAPRWCTS